MPVTIQHGNAGGYEAAISFLIGLNQQRTRQEQEAAAAAQRQQQFDAQAQAQVVAQAQAAAALGQRADEADQHAALQQYEIDQRTGAARAAAGLNFINNQQRTAIAAAGQQANIDANFANNQDRQNAALINAQTDLMKAQQAEQRQQENAELQANLQLRNDLIENTPAMLDPTAMAQAQANIQANQHALTAPGRYENQMIREGIAKGDPEAIKAGLSRGLLYYSPEQKTRIKQLKNALSQVTIDPKLSPAQRAIAEAQLLRELNSIRPMEADEEPLVPIEQIQRETVTMPHQDGGPPITYKRTYRNGREGWEPDKFSVIDRQRWNDQQFEMWKQQRGIESSKKSQPATLRESLQNDGALFNRFYDSVRKALIRIDADTGLEIQPTEAETEAEMRRRIDLQERMRSASTNGSTTGASGQQPAVNAIDAMLSPPINHVQPQITKSIESRQDLIDKLISGEVVLGDFVNTPKGPRQVTDEVITKLAHGQQ
jgi:hypothetical protein